MKLAVVLAANLSREKQQKGARMSTTIGLQHSLCIFAGIGATHGYFSRVERKPP
jgi:hypothetical protein